MSKKKRKEKHMKKAGAWKGFFFILPSLCGLILFYLLPYLDVIKRYFSSRVFLCLFILFIEFNTTEMTVLKKIFDFFKIFSKICTQNAFFDTI